MEDIESLDPDFLQQPKPTPAESEPAKPTRLLSLHMEPGFRCFFKNWVQNEKVPIYECYDLVLKSHLHLDKLRWPTSKLLAQDDVSLTEKTQMLLSRSTQHERFFIRSRNDVLYKNTYAKDKEERIKQLEMQVELYRRRREEALEAKREHFKKLSNQQQEAQRRIVEEKQRRQQVLNSLRMELGASYSD